MSPPQPQELLLLFILEVIWHVPIISFVFVEVETRKRYHKQMDDLYTICQNSKMLRENVIEDKYTSKNYFWCLVSFIAIRLPDGFHIRWSEPRQFFFYIYEQRTFGILNFDYNSLSHISTNILRLIIILCQIVS